MTDRLDIVKDLVEHGADVNYLHENPKSSIPMTPLMLGAEGCPAWAPYSKGDYCYHRLN